MVGGHSHTFQYSGTPPVASDVAEYPYPYAINIAGRRPVAYVSAGFGGRYATGVPGHMVASRPRCAH